MTVDRQLLASLRSYDDPRLGIRESFLTPQIGGASSIAVLSTPLNGTPSGGWVVCPSFAFEQVNLMPLEVALARALAAAGFAVLRYHGQGYGDSALGSDVISAASHQRDASSATDVLRAEADVHEVGIVGARFGAAIAALVAGAAGASRLALIDPAVRGGAYLRGLVRRAELASYGNRDAISGWLAVRDRADAVAAEDSSGESSDVLDLGDVLVTPRLAAEMEALDAASGGLAFTGRSLLVQVSRQPEVRAETRAMAAALGDADGRCRVEIVADDTAIRFGLPRLRLDGDGQRVDGQARLSANIVERVVGWAVEPVR